VKKYQKPLSVCRKQIDLVITIPHSESSMNGYIMWFVMGDKRDGENKQGNVFFSKAYRQE
jgi:O-glycosyl hydrolase